MTSGAPARVIDFLANVWSLGLIAAVVLTLAWFVYSLWLKRLWRMRRIANIRLRRMLEDRDQSEK